MLRRLSLLIMLVAGAVMASAQHVYSPNMSVGVHGGATLSEMSFSPSISQKFTQGVELGVNFRYAEEKIVGLIAELNLTQRGWAEQYDEGYEQFEYTRTLTYIQLPVMTHIFFGPKRVRMFINLGPEVGYMIGSSISANFDYKNPGAVEGYPGGYRQTEQLDMDIHTRMDYGIAAGVGVEWQITRRYSVYAEGRYYYGLGNIFPSSKKDYFSASRTMSVEVTAGIRFRIL